MRRTGVQFLLLTAFATIPLAGCNDGAPFPMEEVRGMVKYEDGSAIPADRIRIVFEPQDREPAGNVTPAAAETYADGESGSFDNLTTWKYGDGVIVGRHKVCVTALRVDEQGMASPNAAVPKIYHRPDTTPLDVEVVRGGDNTFDLRIQKKPAS